MSEVVSAGSSRGSSAGGPTRVVRMAVLYDLLTHGPAGVEAGTVHELGVA